MTDHSVLVDDLAAEQDSLAAVVAELSDADWELQTPAQGWLVRDQIFHLYHYDVMGLATVTAPEVFEGIRLPSFADPVAYENWHLTAARALAPEALASGFAAARGQLVAALRAAGGRARVAWYGPSMSVSSFVTARLMEWWAHGTDVREAIGLRPEVSPRLRHVAHIGVITRRWSFALRNLQVPAVEPRVELAGPDGQTWTWGPEDSPESVTGSALDFALLATQRINRADTALIATGPGADAWLDVAQAFAGAPGPGRPRRITT